MLGPLLAPYAVGPRRQAPPNVASILDPARELGIRDAQVADGAADADCAGRASYSQGRRGRGASSRTGRAGTLRLGAAGDGRGVAGSGRSRWRDPSTAAARLAGRSGGASRQRSLRGHPHRHIAASNEGLIVGWPVRNAVLRLVSGMDLRLHPCSVAPAETRRTGQTAPPADLHATTPRDGLS